MVAPEMTGDTNMTDLNNVIANLRRPQLLIRAARPPTTTLPDGKSVKLPADGDPRDVFCDWLVTPQNPWFVRTIANRVWAWLMGRGIIHEPDDLRPDNPPRNPELLAALEAELVQGKWDLKRLIRSADAPSPEKALPVLVAVEEQMEETRRAGDAGYSIARHVEILIAMIAEMRLIPRNGLV